MLSCNSTYVCAGDDRVIVVVVTLSLPDGIGRARIKAAGKSSAAKSSALHCEGMHTLAKDVNESRRVVPAKQVWRGHSSMFPKPPPAYTYGCAHSVAIPSGCDDDSTTSANNSDDDDDASASCNNVVRDSAQLSETRLGGSELNDVDQVPLRRGSLWRRTDVFVMVENVGP